MPNPLTTVVGFCSDTTARISISSRFEHRHARIAYWSGTFEGSRVT